MSDQALPDIPLPSGWAQNVKSAVLHAISLAQFAIACARGWAANSINARVRLAADNDRLKQDNQLLREELRIKDVRMAKLDTRRRPYYPPTLLVHRSLLGPCSQFWPWFLHGFSLNSPVHARS